MASASAVIRRGSCLCRRVTFTLTGSPARNIQCNCLNCQKASGSAFLANVLYKRDQYAISSGEDLIKTYIDKDVDSGGTLERNFCGNCGSPLSIKNVSNPKMSGNIVIPGGTIEDNWKEWKPQSELFGHRRHAWLPEVQKKKTTQAGKAKL